MHLSAWVCGLASPDDFDTTDTVHAPACVALRSRCRQPDQQIIRFAL